jgi:protein-tyrosine phosphatase
VSTRWVDLHNHVIPGVDDGARDGDQARAAVAALAAEGARVVVATPHLDASLTQTPGALAPRLEEFDDGWARLIEAADGDVRLERGTEVRLDVPTVDLTDARLRLGGSRTVLVEFPYMSVPPRSAAVLMDIRREGFVPLLAHPERYGNLDPDLTAAASWLDVGACLQVNTGSLTGRYGARTRRRALELLGRGWVHCLASDYHSNGAPGIAPVRRLLESWGGEEVARLLFEENPSRMLADEPCASVPPLQPRRSLGVRLNRFLPWS